MIDNIKNERYIIFASDENEEYTKNFLNKCNINFKQLHGRYNGENETSYIINKNSEHLIMPIVDRQESVLELTEIMPHGNREAVLKFLAVNELMPLGAFTSVSKKEAEAGQAYTYDPSSDLYFVTKRVQK